MGSLIALQKALTMNNTFLTTLDKITENTNCVVFVGDEKSFFSSLEFNILNYLTDGLIAKKGAIKHLDCFITPNFSSNVFILFCSNDEINHLTETLESKLSIFDHLSKAKSISVVGANDNEIIKKHTASFLKKHSYQLVF